MKTFRHEFKRICFYKNISLAEQRVSVVYEAEQENEVIAYEKLFELEWTRGYEGPVKGGPGYSSWLIGDCKEIMERYEDIPDRSAPVVDFSNSVPDVAESVTYIGENRVFFGEHHWRVSGWYCQDEKRPWTLRHCTREEAQVISLTGVCGAIVRIDEVERSGQYVRWSAQVIETEIKNALNRIGRFDTSPLDAKRYIPDAPAKPSEKEFMDMFMKELVNEIPNKEN